MIKLVDQLSPMGNFAVATATDIVCSDNERLQDKIDNGTLGGDTSQTVTEAEYLALPEAEKLNNSYYLYDIGVHYKNGVAYSRKKPIQLTMEEYKALGEVDPDQEYIVSADTVGILLGAEDIGYNNAVSNLPCTTVQGAIDKVVEKVDGLISDTTSSTTSTWSSQKTSDEIAKVDTELKGSIEELSNNFLNKISLIPANAYDNGTLTDALLVDLYDKNGVNNKPKLVLNNTTELNMPSDCAWGVREVFFYSCNKTAKLSYLIVKITGCDTDGKPGLWQNIYNASNWYGWVRIGNFSQ